MHSFNASTSFYLFNWAGNRSTAGCKQSYIFLALGSHGAGLCPNIESDFEGFVIPTALFGLNNKINESKSSVVIQLGSI